MGDYRRTMIKRLEIQRYRSIEHLVLEDLPPIIVLYGKNGSGKSNILRAVQLVLAAAAQPERLPLGEQQALVWSLKDAEEKLRLRPDDFRYGDSPEIRISITLDLTTRASVGGRELLLDAVFRNDFNENIRFWLDRAEDSPEKKGEVFLGNTHLRSTGLRRLLQTSEAYRVPGDFNDPQEKLHDAFLAEDLQERVAAQRLGERLASARLFGIERGSVGLLPVNARTYGEKQVRFRHPTHGELPLRNLGSGEQQVVFMLGQRVITPYPIALLEEPEAHLHWTLMEPFARVLRESVLGDGGTPDVDQLWMATHHHLFAISEVFYDVRLDENGVTQVEQKKPRAKAGEHFYEPGPLWGALQSLLAAGLDRKTILFRRSDGSPATAGDIEASEAGDRALFNEWAAFASRQVVLSMKTRAEKGQ
jgi:AAA domain, putative AbiEii toxin, Type IV TA system